MREIWKDVPGYEGMYQVSDCGRVRSLDRVVETRNGQRRKYRGGMMKLTKGLVFLHLSLTNVGERRTHNVHALVMEAFVGPRPKGMEVCHGPKGQLVNSLHNLRYGTPSENHMDMRRDGTRYVKAVVRSDGKRYPSQTEAAEDSGYHNSQICMVCKGRVKTAGGFSWVYA